MPAALIIAVGVLLISACSSSQSPVTSNSSSDAIAGNVDQPIVPINGDVESAVDPAGVVEDSQTESSDALKLTQVNFDITVPVYVSDTLQVQIRWGEKSLTASWVKDESWSATGEFPVNTENFLNVTFFDNNGALTLASFAQPFKTAAGSSETYGITASQFETAQWDDDNDGVSNLAESTAGTSPANAEFTESAQARVELLADKTFRISWQAVPGAQFYRVLENADGVSGFTTISDELSVATLQYEHRVALLKRLNASYIVQACAASNCTESQPLQVPDAIDSAAVYFKASNTDSGDRFGEAVSLSADGNTLAIGASDEAGAATGVNSDDKDNSYKDSTLLTVGSGAGAVYIFQRTDERWQQEAYIKPDSIGPSDNFGANIDLSADGKTLVVGAQYENLEPLDEFPYSTADTSIVGAAYVFSRANGTWKQQRKFKPDIYRERDFFGEDVSVSGNGNRVSIIGRNHLHYVYERINDNWQLQADLSTNKEDECPLGDSVSMSDDGNTIVVGNSSGTAKIFVYKSEAWTRQACLSPKYKNVADEFGYSVSVSGNGNTLAIGAYRDAGAGIGINGSEQRGDGSRSGAVFMYERSNDTWQQSAYIKGGNSETANEFGRRLALSADAKNLAITSSGGIHVYVHENGNWRFLSLLDVTRDNSFGSDVSLSANGDAMAAGSSSDDSAATGIDGFRDDTSALGSGAVFLY